MEPAGGLSGACLAVRAPCYEVCRICCGALEGPFEICWSCRQIERGLRRRLLAVTPISLTKRSTGLYTALRQYKGRPNSIARRQQLRLAELLEEFLGRHLACVAPEGIDVVTVVPSSQVPAESHPLAATLRSVPQLHGKVADALCPKSAALERNVPDPDVYGCERSAVEGLRVLLVDDVYTTGAHVHSAAALLEDCGASSVSILVVARHQDPQWSPARRLLEWSASTEHTWSLETCVRCAGS